MPSSEQLACSATLAPTAPYTLPNQFSVGVGIANINPSYTLHVGGRIRSTGINETSDARLKTNIQTLDSALAKVRELRGVSFEWIDSLMANSDYDSGAQLGVIAQEIQQVAPAVVLTDEQGYHSVEFSKLVALLDRSPLRNRTKQCRSRADS